MKIHILFALILIFTTVGNLNAQDLNTLDQLFPMDLIDARSSLHKTVMGIGSSVNVSFSAGIKYLDACDNQTSTGALKVEIRWYDANDESGMVLLQMLTDLNGIEQEKESFLSGGVGERIEGFSKGTLKISSNTKACMNEITGPTGETEYSTEAKYFAFLENRLVFITLSDKMKPETAKKIISKIADEVSQFDFSAFRETVTN